MLQYAVKRFIYLFLGQIISYVDICSDPLNSTKGQRETAGTVLVYTEVMQPNVCLTNTHH